jgi:aryl-alcohol dehydrogenase-like predicted oxidoreductase
VWSPLAGGLLSGKYSFDADGKTEGEGRRAKLDFPKANKQLASDLVDAMRPMASSRAVTVPAIALAWLLHQPVVSSVIVGVKRADQLAENLAASDVELLPEELAELDALSALEPEYPGWSLGMQTANNAGRVSPRRIR